MGGELDPGEEQGQRYNFSAMGRIDCALSDSEVDPVPLLALLRQAARDEHEEDHVFTGPFETAYYVHPRHRERILELATPAWREMLKSLST